MTSPLDWLQELLGGGAWGDPSVPAMPTGAPQVPDALSRLGGYLDNSASNLGRIPGGIGRALDWAGTNVAAPALGQMADLYERDQSGQPLYGGVNEKGEVTGRLADLGAALTPYLAGGAPGGAMSSGIRTGAPIRAYHGSPHDFDRFDIGKIGTGEGAQAYGHGLYFAEKEGVARGYRDALAPTNTKWMYGDKELSGAEQNAAELLDRSGSVESALSHIRHALRPGRMADQKYLDATEAAVRRMDPAQVRVVQSPGHMYEVDIHADPKAFLDWDKPLGQQSEQARGAIQAAIGPGNYAGDRGRTLYDMLSNAYDKRFFTGGRVEATEALRDAGIPGIRYLDQGSRGAGAGTSNYAVFDDKLIEILRKYGLLPPVMAGGLLGAVGGEEGAY